MYATALCYNTGQYIFAWIFTYFSLFEVKIQALNLGKNPGKYIISKIIDKAVVYIILFLLKPKKNAKKL